MAAGTAVDDVAGGVVDDDVDNAGAGAGVVPGSGDSGSSLLGSLLESSSSAITLSSSGL